MTLKKPTKSVIAVDKGAKKLDVAVKYVRMQIHDMLWELIEYKKNSVRKKALHKNVQKHVSSS